MDPKMPPGGPCLTAAGSFAACLHQAAAQHPPSKSRRIAALLPEIEVALAQGSSRAHIVSALMGVGIQVSAHQLTNVIARLRKQAPRSEAASPVPALSSGNGLDEATGLGVEKSAAPSSAAALLSAGHPLRLSLPQATSAPTLVPLTRPTAPSRFGAHDPRLLDEVMRSTPDMKALAKLASRPKTQGIP